MSLCDYKFLFNKLYDWLFIKWNSRNLVVLYYFLEISSNQDTVVALQAMASYESHLYQGDLNMVIQVKASGLDHSFSVDESNKLLTQRVTLPDLPTTVSLSTMGQGCAVFQVG